MIRSLDALLDRLTMYRLVLYYLLAIVAAAFVLGFMGLVPQDPTDLAFTTVLIVVTCWVANRAFAWIYRAPVNAESVYITALILVLIMDPVSAHNPQGVGAVICASVWAIASKFILAIRQKHIFNPAALGIALTALLLDRPATWWVGGTTALLPIVLAGGLLLVYRLRRFDLVAVFALFAVVTQLTAAEPSMYATVLRETFQSSPLLFFAFVMLTEPLTAPTTRLWRLLFAAVVGFLFAPDIHIGSFYLTPELALLAGNVFAWAVGMRGRMLLTLERIERPALDTYDFIFRSPRKLAFEAGQYLELTLGMDHSDNRGNRRYFTVASAPTETGVRLGVKFYQQPSAFKRSLAGMKPGSQAHVAEVAGDFTLPADPDAKLAFIAGGIGITPFRSMLQYLVDRGESRPVVVVYGTESQDDIAYRDVLQEARARLGIRTVHAVANGAGRGQYPGYIDEKLLRAAVPDYLERTFYVSGPRKMVKTVTAVLRGMGVRRYRIRVDYFPGLG